jgi:hypothetical protein
MSHEPLRNGKDVIGTLRLIAKTFSLCGFSAPCLVRSAFEGARRAGGTGLHTTRNQVH